MPLEEMWHFVRPDPTCRHRFAFEPIAVPGEQVELPDTEVDPEITAQSGQSLQWFHVKHANRVTSGSSLMFHVKHEANQRSSGGAPA